MAKSPDQLKENIPNKKNIVAEVQELKSTNYTLSTKNTELKKEHVNLKAALANADEKLKTVSVNTETEVVKNLKILNSRVSSEKAELEKEYANLKAALASVDSYNKDVAKTTEDALNKGTVVHPSLLHANFFTIPNSDNTTNESEIIKIQELEKKNNTLSTKNTELEKEYANFKTALASTEEKLKTVSISTDEKIKALENKNCTIFNNESLLMKEYEGLKNKYTNLKNNLKNKYENFKTTLASADEKLEAGFANAQEKLKPGFAYENFKTKYSSTDEKSEKEKITVDNESKSNSTISEKNAYNMLNPTIEKIKSEYFFSNNNGDEVEKVAATSINQRESNTKCFEISDSSLKSLESESSDCEKIYSLHNFLDSIGMDEDDDNHLQFFKFHEH